MKRILFFDIFIISMVISVLSGCGGINMVLPSEGTYRVAAMVGAINLDAQALVKAEDTIYPVFLSDVSDDPDVVGLSISLLDSQGKTVMNDVVYLLDSVELDMELDEDRVDISITSLSESLPSFSLPENLERGFYTLVFKVLSSQVVLSESRREFYYLDTMYFSIDEIRTYPPGKEPSSTAPLFPPEVSLLVEVPIEADPFLDPYILWSQAGKVVAEGLLSEGADRLLWKTPNKDGFHTLGVEVLPEKPDLYYRGDLNGLLRQLSIAVSAKAPKPGLLELDGSYVRHFRFLGDLKDDLTSELALAPLLNSIPEWLTGNDTYGLAIGPKASFALDQTLIPLVEGVDRADIYMRFAVLSSGIILESRFNTLEGEDPLGWTLSTEDGKLLFTMGASEEPAMMIPLPANYDGTFINLKLSMELHALDDVESDGETPENENSEDETAEGILASSLSLSLSLDDGISAEITLPGEIQAGYFDAGAFTIGKLPAKTSPVEESLPEDEDPLSTIEVEPQPVFPDYTAIMDEIAVRVYSAAPAL